MNHDFYLASRSPRRAHLLRQAGYRFDCVAADIDEQPTAGEAPGAFAQRMARGKARAALAQMRPSQRLPVLAADTDVSIDGEILGKPSDRAHCIQMLMRLSSRRHSVYTAVVMSDGPHASVVQSCTQVCFGPISEDEAGRYWDSGEPRDKAGAYAIQGVAARWIRSIDGSHSGVIGLPMFETTRLLAEFGIQASFPCPEDPT